MSIFKSVGKFLFGEKQKDVTSGYEKAGIEEGVNAQRTALRGLMSTGVTQDLKPQVEMEKSAIRSSAEDTLRRLKDLRVARGQVGTSLGVGQESGIMRQSALQQAMLGAQMPERLRQMQRNEFMQNIQAANPLAGITRQIQQGSSGVVAPMLVAGAGAAAGAATGKLVG
jgi:hypothetical protein